MKFIGIFLRFLGVAALAATGIFAADLRNEDGKRYEVKVYDGGTVRNTWIDANSSVIVICSNCEIEVVGIGRMKVSGSDRLIIRNGSVAKQ